MTFFTLLFIIKVIRWLFRFIDCVDIIIVDIVAVIWLNLKSSLVRALYHQRVFVSLHEAIPSLTMTGANDHWDIAETAALAQIYDKSSTHPSYITEQLCSGLCSCGCVGFPQLPRILCIRLTADPKLSMDGRQTECLQCAHQSTVCVVRCGL